MTKDQRRTRVALTSGQETKKIEHLISLKPFIPKPNFLIFV